MSAQGPMGFSVRIADLRYNARLEQKELAEKLKITRLAIINWEAGRSFPTYWTLLEIARFFNVDLNWLMGHTVYVKEQAAQTHTSV